MADEVKKAKLELVTDEELDEEEREFVVLAQHAEVIRALGKRVVHDVIEIGRRLTDAKARCGHGNWLPWLEREFGWSDSTALRYMQAHQFATDKSVTVTDLSLKSLYLLAAPSTPEAARDEVIERSEAGEHLTPAQIKETIDKAVNAEIEAKLQTVRAEADEREAAIRAEYEGRVYLTPEQLQAQVDKAMIPLHKQIQKYEDKLAKNKEREEKRAEAAKKNAGKADRRKPPIDRELSLAETGVRSSLRDIFRQIECLTPKQMIDVAADRARITEQSIADVLGDAPHQATVVSEWLAQYAASAKPTVPLVPPDNTDPSDIVPLDQRCPTSES